jgi:hypothetical protein
LQGAVRDRRKKNRNHQSQKLIVVESRPTTGFPDCIEQACAGDDEKERHHPSGGKNIPYLHPDKGIDILDMKITQIKESCTVVNKNDQDGPYAKPVKFISSF